MRRFAAAVYAALTAIVVAFQVAIAPSAGERSLWAPVALTLVATSVIVDASPAWPGLRA